jgi:hypothetical protein
MNKPILLIPQCNQNDNLTKLMMKYLMQKMCQSCCYLSDGLNLSQGISRKGGG